MATSCPDFVITVVAGPTAAGKSAFAEELAHKKNGIIINADSLQIYDALPILTAQPSQKTKSQLPHALYGMLQPDQICDVARWIDLAKANIESAQMKGQHPIIVGGTGLYLKALINGLSPIPLVPPSIREQARNRQSQIGNKAFHAELARLDPLMAVKLKPTDTQRLIRAYEVFLATQKSLSFWQSESPVPPFPNARFESILIDGPRAVLRTRAELRLHHMIDLGVLDEIAAFQTRLEKEGFDPDSPPTRALGYHAFAGYLRGDIDKETALMQAHTETCQYIKRQQTWFRHQMVFQKTITIA